MMITLMITMTMFFYVGMVLCHVMFAMIIEHDDHRGSDMMTVMITISMAVMVMMMMMMMVMIMMTMTVTVVVMMIGPHGQT